MAGHVTKPKSSKGRPGSNKGESDPQQNGGGSLFSAEFGVGGPDTLLRPQSRREMRISGYMDGSAAGQSLHKYKVLPSIEKGKGRPKHRDQHLLTGRQIFKFAEGCAERAHTTGHVLGTCSSEDGRKVALSPDTLLLAIKDPAGRRFEQRFRPSDTLLHVRASAEATYGLEFGQKTTIGTMEVPRRSFNNMSLTLAQCGISDKSVLCIFQSEDE